jgi:hypothetical protein
MRSAWSIVPSSFDSEITRADKRSEAPISSPAVSGIRTKMAEDIGFRKPDGRYSMVNPELVARNRKRQAEQFLLMLEAENSFDETFKEEVA